MYTITKSSKVVEQLELKDENGNSEILNIEINISPELAKRYRTLQVQLMNLQNKHPNNDTERIEQIGECITKMFQLLFGDVNSERIFRFYENNYIVMCNDIFPFIQNVIIPQIQKFSKSREKQMKRRFR